MMDGLDLEAIATTVRCCACSGALTLPLNVFQLQAVAHWPHPHAFSIEGDLQMSDKPRAMAFVCQGCVDHSTPVKFAVEWLLADDGTSIAEVCYHAIDGLEKIGRPAPPVQIGFGVPIPSDPVLAQLSEDELNLLIAEHVFRWAWRQIGDGIALTPPDGDPIPEHEARGSRMIPRWSTRPSASAALVANMIAHEFEMFGGFILTRGWWTKFGYSRFPGVDSSEFPGESIWSRTEARSRAVAALQARRDFENWADHPLIARQRQRHVRPVLDLVDELDGDATFERIRVGLQWAVEASADLERLLAHLVHDKLLGVIVMPNRDGDGTSRRYYAGPAAAQWKPSGLVQ